jgi:hypothetical protein
VLVVVVTVGCVPVPVVDIVHMLVMPHGIVAATGPVLMLVTWMSQVRQRVLVIVPVVRHVRVALVHIVDVPFPLHAGMTAAGAMLVAVVCVRVVIGGCHGSSQLCWTASATM